MYASTPEIALEGLRDQLANPPITVSIDQALDLWDMTIIRFICERPKNLDDFPEFSVRLRGAFGIGIKNMPPITNRRGLYKPPASAVLFSPMGKLPNGDDIPKPLIIRGWVEDNKVNVEVRLVGIAMNFAEEAEHAMREMLGRGITLKRGRSIYVPLPIIECEHQHLSAMPPPCSANRISMNFKSPVSIRRKNKVTHSGRSILLSLRRRVSMMAPWQSLRLSADDKFPHEVSQAKLDERGLASFTWQRFSQNTGATPIPMQGQLGTMIATGSLEQVAKYCKIAEQVNTGSHAALGLGWFKAAFYP